MKHLFLSVSLTVIGSVFAVASHADPMAVFKGRAIFIASDDSLTVLPDLPNQLSCSYDAVNQVFIPVSTPDPVVIPLPGAMDVKIIGNHAYVATSITEESPAIGYAKYDVSACIPDGSFTPSVATANLASGELVIPCVLVDGSEYNVVMNRRGNSMNWEVIFADPQCN